jgi:hypothetical protein
LKKLFFLILSFALLPWAAWSQTSTPALPKKISTPLFLSPADKTPLSALNSPAVPNKGSDGNSLEVNEAIDAPPADSVVQFSDPELFEKIKATKKKETEINRVYWHTSGDLGYGHFRDNEGNNWYGWSDGQAFHWILSLGNRYWWHDDFAGHWLYFAKNYWWRADGQSANQIQVIIDGEYYLCQRDGTILKDMGQDGNGQMLSASGRYQGDSHGGRGGHGSGHGGGHGEGHSANGANAGSAGGNSGSAASGAGASGQ